MSVLTARASPADMRAARLARFAAPVTAATTASTAIMRPALPHATTSSTAPRTTIDTAPRAATTAPRTTTDTAPRAATTTTDAASLFRMGFDAEDVGRALVATQGDAAAALQLLQKPATPASPPAPIETEDDEEKELALAIQMSLQQAPAKAAPRVTTDANPLWSPPRYVPAADGGGAKTLSLVEQVRVRDGGYAWQPAQAFLDTGNQHMTIVDARYAARHALYRGDTAIPALHGAGLGQAERWTTLRGVVPGVTSRAPVVTLALSIRGQDMLVQAAVSELGHQDLLLGVDVLDKLFASGYRIGAGSM